MSTHRSMQSNNRLRRAAKLARGLKEVPIAAQLVVAKESYPVVELAQRFEAHASDLAELNRLEDELRELRGRIRRKGPLLRRAANVIRRMAASLFPPGSPELARLGFAPPGVPTPPAFERLPSAPGSASVSVSALPATPVELALEDAGEPDD